MGCWECPLCCRKSFPNKLTLKYHLLSSIVLACPNCRKSFNGILELADHLDGSCGDEHDSSATLGGDGERIYVGNIKRPNRSKLTAPNNVAGSYGLQASKAGSSQQVATSESVNLPFVTEGMELLEQWQTENGNGQESTYFCVTCNCNIQGVMEHIKECHSDESQIYVQEEGIPESTMPVPESTMLDPIGMEHPGDEVPEECSPDGTEATEGDEFSTENSGSTQIKLEPEVSIYVVPCPEVEEDALSNLPPEELVTNEAEPMEDVTNEAEPMEDITNSKPGGVDQQADTENMGGDGVEDLGNLSDEIRTNNVKAEKSVLARTTDTSETSDKSRCVSKSIQEQGSISSTIIDNSVVKTSTSNDSIVPIKYISNVVKPEKKITAVPTQSHVASSSVENVATAGRKCYATSINNLISKVPPKASTVCQSPGAGSLNQHGTTSQPHISSPILVNNVLLKERSSGSIKDGGSDTLCSDDLQLSEYDSEDENSENVNSLPSGSQFPTKSTTASSCKVPAKLQNIDSVISKQKTCQISKIKIPEPAIVEKSNLVDKTGMHYVRNVVKIEKFWDAKTSVSRPSTHSDSTLSSLSDSKPVKTSQVLSKNSKDGSSKRISTVLTQNSEPRNTGSSGVGTEENEHQYAQQIPDKQDDSAIDSPGSSNSPPKKKVKGTQKETKLVKDEDTSLDVSGIKSKGVKRPAPVLPDPIECPEGDGNTTLLCSVCSGKFATHDVYRSHKCKKKGRTYLSPSSCTLCEVVCISPCDLEMHQHLHRDDVSKAERTRIRERICEICNMLSYSPVRFKTHFNIHIMEKQMEKRSAFSHLLGILKCSQCNAVFRTNEELIEHWKTHNDDTQTDFHYQKTPADVIEEEICREFYLCAICNKRVPEGGREAHDQLHRGKKNLTCPVCNKPFYNNSKTDLEFHMLVHNTDNKFPCFYCKQKFENVFLLRKHVTDTHPMLNRPYPCSFCGRRFFKATEMRKHEKIHTGEKKYQCEVCGALFRNAYCRRIHLRIHTGNRPYCCQECGKTFRTQPGYNHHVRIHSDARPYTCSHCPKTFKSRVNLGNHIRQHEKRFTCPNCGRRFADLFSLRHHLKAHAQGSLTAACIVCGASYGRDWSLQEHMKAEHPDVILPPPVTPPSTPAVTTRSAAATRSEETKEKKPRKSRRKTKQSSLDQDIENLLSCE